ncbi:MAG: GDP-L-fucose synthase family protein [Mariprofundaceae bacterium]
MNKDSKIYVAGHRGLVGSAIMRKLRAEGYGNVVIRTSGELDLRNQAAADAFFIEEKIDYVFLAAARVGGIYANDTYPADFIRDNLQIQTNVIDAAYRNKVKRLLFLGSSCIYPKMASQPMSESCLLTGELELTNEWYAIAKIAGIKMCQAYHKQFGFDAISVMPTNLYGPNDNFDLENSHVLPALIRKFHLARLAQTVNFEAIKVDEARHGRIPDNILSSLGLKRDLSSILHSPSVRLWGTGSPYREFLHVDDMATAALFLMSKRSQVSNPRLYNVGYGSDIRIRDLADMVRKVVGFDGNITWDSSKPDGTPRKLLDVSLLNSLGWKASIPLEEGIKSVYKTYSEEKREG